MTFFEYIAVYCHSSDTSRSSLSKRIQKMCTNDKKTSDGSFDILLNDLKDFNLNKPKSAECIQ